MQPVEEDLTFDSILVLAGGRVELLAEPFCDTPASLRLRRS